VRAVEQGYWNLLFALRELQVQIDAVKEARSQLESNQRQVEKGVLAPIDIVAAQAQITTFEQNVYIAEEAVTNAENTLKTLLLPDRESPDWSRPITPISKVALEAPKVPLELALADALKNRPELEQLDLNIDINKIDERYFRNQTKPEIDLVGTTTSLGLAGTPTQRSISPITGLSSVPPALIGGIGQSLGNLAGFAYPTYRAGITISLPIGNRVAEANLGRTLSEGDRLKNQRLAQEQTVESDVRNALQSLRSAEARLAAASASRSAAQQLYDSEQRQFRAGTTTLYLVLQRQIDLIAARGRELQAATDLNRSISDFHHATGTTLSVNNIEITNESSLQKVH
jgi:HAE1 family hydrophobic/amphiphilic exporter-1